MIDSTRFRFERYFTPRPTPETADMIDKPHDHHEDAAISPTAPGFGASPVRSIIHSMPVMA